MPKRKRGNGPLTVTSRVTLLPEILGMIFSYLTDDKYIGLGGDGTRNGLIKTAIVPAIYQCLFVNSTWFHEAVRILWQTPTTENIFPLARCFQNIPQSRQQFYANLVRKSNLVGHYKRGVFPFGNARTYIDALYGLSFPKIHTLDVIFAANKYGENIPWIHAPAVTLLSVYFHYYYLAPIPAEGTPPYYLSRKSEHKIVQSLVCLITNRFPAVKWVVLQCQSAPSQMIEWLALKLPTVHVTSGIGAKEAMLQQRISLGQN
ncbi:hypothetical protein N7526_007397 [Penicillium atrosanguineum]|nr:hypothetical protein N7526_007397 [Penicillium atrosanguineum]